MSPSTKITVPSPARRARTPIRKLPQLLLCPEESCTNCAAREWFKEKERCVFCDIVKQEERQGKRMVDTQGDYVALCPYASRVPYEVWILNRKHNYMFEQPRPGANRKHLAALLRRILRRIRQIAPAYHLVVHTAPNTIHPKGETASQ